MANVILKNLTKSFGDTEVLKTLNHTIEDRKFVTLLGPSGCGKTTILRIIAGFEEPTTGSVSIGDTIVSDEKNFIPPEKREIGMVFQSYAVWPHMSVYDNVAYPLKIQKISKDEIERRVLETLDIVHLTQYKDRMPDQLSGGQQQRVALGRALVASPEILLLDEPLSNLDAKLREVMRYEIKEIQEKLGITVVYVTHDQEEAMSMSDEIILIDNGIVQQIGSPEEIYRHPENPFVANFIGKIEFLYGEVIDQKIKIEGTELLLDYNGDLTGRVVVGIRPETMILNKNGEGYPVSLDSKFFLGEKGDFQVFLGDRIIRVLIDARLYDDFEVGEEVHLKITDFYVFEDDGVDYTKINT